MLKTIKEKIDAKWPPKAKLHGTQSERMEALSNKLDAVRNPWRKTTMHVETNYAP